ncbi:PH domain-containing protein [Kitasatospora brasiliensis]|uniref:PH domain-containing protein n=1 Tax=Kitasatospora brasiliensis TaxID=3058040 RepID=UPI002931CAD9|nr:PH domain-containing protein [Kitasatospora sp. K002]
MLTVDHHLAEDEDLIYATRQHWTQLVGEFAVLCLTWAVAGAILWLLPGGDGWGRTASYLVLAAAGIISLWFWLVPLMKWRGTYYVLTTKRLHLRSGFLTKTGHSLPLLRVNDISFQASLWERIIRCGTVNVESASEQGMLTLRHVPDPEGLKNMIYEAMDEAQEHQHGSDGTASVTR